MNISHSGQVDCVAKNLVGEVKDSLNLTIGYPPKVMLNSAGKIEQTER